MLLSTLFRPRHDKTGSRGKLESVKPKRNVSQLRLVESKGSVAPPLEESSSLEPLRVAGLFAGIGGIELGLSRAKHETNLLCEIDSTATRVLEERFPSIKIASDIRELTVLPRNTDLVSAGFPCQDLSQAGKTAGIAGQRSGLIGEVFRLLEKKRTEWILIENVSFMLQLGRGRALEVIVSELERLGYKWAYRVVNSRAFGVPQRRERVYFLASLHNDPRNVIFVDDDGVRDDIRSFREVACGFYWTEGLRGLGWAIDSVPPLKGGSSIGIPSPPAIIFPSRRIAKPDILDAERMQGFPEDWTKPAEQVAKPGCRWKLVGNAVTVNAAEWIGKRLRSPGEYDTTGDLPLRTNASWPHAAWNMGAGRHRAELSSWPLSVPSQSLESFLRHPTVELSAKASAGFLSRTSVAKLRFPDGFLDAVEAHLSHMSGNSLRAIM